MSFLVNSLAAALIRKPLSAARLLNSPAPRGRPAASLKQDPGRSGGVGDMVTYYPHRLASNDGLTSSTDAADRAGDGYVTRVFWWLRQTYCGLSGHDALLQFGRNRM